MKDSKTMKGKNRLVIKEQVLKIEDHKNSKYVECKTVKLCDEFMQYLKHIQDIYSPKFLLSPWKNPEKQLSTRELNRIIHKHFSVSPNDLRNVFVSKEVLDKNKNLQDRKKYAYILGHSINTQEAVYGKYSKNLHGNTKDKMKCLLNDLDKESKKQLLKQLLAELDE